MKVVLVLFALASVVVASVDDGEIDLLREDGFIDVDPQFIISWEVRHQLRKLRKQMSYGWPEYGIPPLAPYSREEVKFHLQTAILETIDDIFRFHVDGLDNFKIKKLNLNIIYRRVKFHFIFKKISIGGTYNTDTILDVLDTLGIKVRLENGGNFDLSLEQISISGYLNYKLPILFGSMKITDFNAVVTLGNVNANISGLLGESRLNQLANDKIEDVIMSGINENTELISAKIKENFVPRVNAMLKGINFWDIWGKIAGGRSSDSPEPEDHSADQGK